MAYEDYDYTDIESKLRQRAQEKGVTYDVSDLEDVKRATQNTGVSGNENLSFDSALDNAYKKYDERAASNGGGGGGSSQPRTSGGNYNGGGGTDLTSQWLDYIKQRDAKVDAERAGQQQKATALYDTFSQRAGQTLAIDPKNDAVIRGQADAYSANEQRAGRDYLADLAEKSGPYANLRGEQRLTAERIGQRTGSFEAELVGRELQQRRDEIAQALNSMAGLLTGDQARSLQEQLSLLDAALGQQRIGLQQQGLDQDWRRALMQNDQFNAQLGLNAEDRAAYWDAVRRGLI